MNELNKLIEGLDIKFPVKYDDNGGYILDADGKMLCEVRGWGWIQYMSDDPEEAHDGLGNLIAHALNNLQPKEGEWFAEHERAAWQPPSPTEPVSGERTGEGWRERIEEAKKKYRLDWRGELHIILSSISGLIFSKRNEIVSFIEKSITTPPEGE